MNGTTCQQMLLNPILFCASKDTLILFYKLASLIITVTTCTQNSDYSNYVAIIIIIVIFLGSAR